MLTVLEKIKAKKKQDRTLGEVMLCALLTGGMWILCVVFAVATFVTMGCAINDRTDVTIGFAMLAVSIFCGVFAYSVSEYMEG